MIGGSFRLGFDGYTTSSIAHDATSSELGVALTDLPSVDSVDVSEFSIYFGCAAELQFCFLRTSVELTRQWAKHWHLHSDYLQVGLSPQNSHRVVDFGRPSD